MTSTPSYFEVFTSLIVRGGDTTPLGNYPCQFPTLCSRNERPSARTSASVWGAWFLQLRAYGQVTRRVRGRASTLPTRRR
jgi:hypothetical protein